MSHSRAETREINASLWGTGVKEGFQEEKTSEQAERGLFDRLIFFDRRTRGVI